MLTAQSSLGLPTLCPQISPCVDSSKTIVSFERLNNVSRLNLRYYVYLSFIPTKEFSCSTSLQSSLFPLLFSLILQNFSRIIAKNSPSAVQLIFEWSAAIPLESTFNKNCSSFTSSWLTHNKYKSLKAPTMQVLCLLA